MNRRHIYLIFLLLLFSCTKEVTNPITSSDLQETLDAYMKEHENLDHVKMIQIEFSKWDDNCSLVFQAYPKYEQSKKSFMYKEKMIVFLDVDDCSKGFINSEYINQKSVLKVITIDEKLDTLKSIYPISMDFYHFDENNKIQYSPKL